MNVVVVGAEPQDMEKLNGVIQAVINEYFRAVKLHGRFNSLHEGYAVILEELDELWEEIKKRPTRRDKEEIRREAVQAAAMLVRLLMEVG